MKKTTIASILSAFLLLSSCSSDDDIKNLSENAAGSYDGYAVASCQYFSNMVSSGQTLKITGASNANEINIAYTSDTFGTFTIDNASVSGTADNISIAGTGKTLMGHAGSEPKEYECSVSGTIVNGDLSLTFSAPSIMGGLNITFAQGDIPAEIVLPGTYKGYTDAKSAYFPSMMANDQSLAITLTDGKYNLEYTSDTWGTFKINDIDVTRSGNTFILSASGTCEMGMNGNVKSYECALSGSVDAEKENPSFTFSVPAVMGGLSIVFHPGNAPE